MIIATAGHVDHGKTLLIKALTGTDTDRLPEEKKRNLTIDLGFAYLPGSDRQTIGFIDVPGHERFIRNMLCGVAGIDFALFVIAADDGPMPQTREHLAILNLLEVSAGAVALTKIDRVSADRVSEVSQEITELLSGTSLSGIPIFPVSAAEGIGVEDLHGHLMDRASQTPARAAKGNFRLAVDRCFEVVGAGTVVTGTVFSGAIETGNRVRVAGRSDELRIRSLHAQNQAADTGQAGQRCALNLAGPTARKDMIRRGDWIVADDVPDPVSKIDARLHVLESEPRAFAHWTPVHIHIAASETTGRVALLEGKSVEPGGSGLVQLVLDHPIGAVFGDHFVLRDQTAQRTVGGGSVIDIVTPMRGRARPERLEQIRAMEVESDAAAIAARLDASPAGLNLTGFLRTRNLTSSEADKLLETVTAKVINLTDDTRIAFAADHWETLCDRVRETLKSWHAAHPDLKGLGENQLLKQAGYRRTAEASRAVAQELVRDGVLVREAAGVRLPTHRAKLQGPDQKLWDKVRPLMEEDGLRPASLPDLAQRANVNPRQLESFLVRAGRQKLVHRISKTRFCTADTLRELAGVAETIVSDQGTSALTAAAFRDASGIGRNMAIEVLEYFDHINFTQRRGDGREIRTSATEILSHE